METDPIKLSVVIPVFNEKKNVGILYDEVKKACDPLERRYEIIMVDDGSTDNTLEILRSLKAMERLDKKSYGKLRIIQFSRNFGQTPAMQAGFDVARGETIVSMDGDLQNDPRDIPRLIELIERGFDVVCGWRKNRHDKRLTRIIPSKIANWIIRKITGISIHDRGCSLKAYRADVIKSIHLYSDMHRFIPAMTSLVGARITELVVNHRPRKYGRTKYGLSRVWKVLFDMVTIEMLLHFNQQPLRWFALLGSVALGLGLAFAATAIFVIYTGAPSVVFSGASFLFLSLLGSLMAWGFLADFFVKIERRRSYPKHGLTREYERIMNHNGVDS